MQNPKTHFHRIVMIDTQDENGKPNGQISLNEYLSSLYDQEDYCNSKGWGTSHIDREIVDTRACINRNKYIQTDYSFLADGEMNQEYMDKIISEIKPNDLVDEFSDDKYVMLLAGVYVTVIKDKSTDKNIYLFPGMLEYKKYSELSDMFEFIRKYFQS